MIKKKNTRLEMKRNKNEHRWSELTVDEKVDIISRNILMKCEEEFKELAK